MRAFVLLLSGGAAAFVVSLHLFRAALGTTAAESSRGGPLIHNWTAAEGSTPPSSESGRIPDRTAAGGNTAFLRVPPALVESISIMAIDPEGGDFTPEMQELLDLDAREFAGTKAIFDAYFKAFTAAELDLATVISHEERPDDRSGRSESRRFATIRIAPAGDRLAKEYAAMRSQLVDLLGRPRGLAAAAVISRQLGNNGRGGEVVGFSKNPNDTLYRLQVDGLGDHALRAGSFGSAPIYEHADFSELARYRHLGVLLRR
jgi:hypothetical protein